MKWNTLTLEQGGDYDIITMNRPDRLNPLDLEAGEEINSVLDMLQKKSEARALLLTGTGRAFSAGGDVKGMKESLEKGEPDHYMDELTRGLYNIALKLRRFPRPVVAGVNGMAVGAGMNLALSCDYIVASEEATFAQGFSKLALIPGFGGTYLLARQIPWQKACEIAFTGEPVPAHEMARLGFVNRVVPRDSFEEECRAATARFAAGPTETYRLTKELFLGSMNRSLDEHMEIERAAQVRVTRTEDYRRGVESILKKDKPLFKGN